MIGSRVLIAMVYGYSLDFGVLNIAQLVVGNPFRIRIDIPASNINIVSLRVTSSQLQMASLLLEVFGKLFRRFSITGRFTSTVQKKIDFSNASINSKIVSDYF